MPEISGRSGSRATVISRGHSGNIPCDAGELVGKRDRKAAVMQPLLSGPAKPLRDHARVLAQRKKCVENVRRFPERRVRHAGKAMAPPAPQIRIFRNVEIIEVDKRIFGTIHDSQRDRTILDEPALIYPDTRTCGLKNRLSCEAIRSLT
jgi:hypothetical protein